MRHPRSKTTWTKEQIRAARAVDLPALLLRKGFHLRQTDEENYLIREHPGIILKRSFWRDAQDDRAGNAVDFFVFVLGMSFAEAMQAILGREGRPQ